MNRKFLFVAIILFIAIAGCQKSEAAQAPQIQREPYTTVSPQSKFAAFSKLPTVTSEPDPDGFKFNGVGIATEGAYVMVQFVVSPKLNERLVQDFIYVVDEQTKVVYKDIPVMPVIGPLIGRPQRENQLSYVMLVNYGMTLKPGDIVSVVIGNYKREHVKVSGLEPVQ